MIVVVPMAAVGFLVFRLIDNSQSGKADARSSGVASAALSLYENASRQASLRARTVATDLALTPVAQLRSRAVALAGQAGLARITIKVGSVTAVDTGDRTAIAPGLAVVTASGARAARTVAVSDLTAAQYTDDLRGPGIQVVVRSGDGTTLAATLPAAAGLRLPNRGPITIGADSYRVVTRSFAGFNHAAVDVSVLSNVGATAGSVGDDRLLAAVFIVGFLLLAFFFSLLASRALHGQLSRFLEAARRLGSGDFSSPVPTAGRDEFALLGEEFNNMSKQLERRLGELEQERFRVRKSIRRIGEAFASGLDRDALLELALQTAMDATNAERGRVSARQTAADPLKETIHVGRLAGAPGDHLRCRAAGPGGRRGRRSLAGRRPSGHRGAGTDRPRWPHPRADHRLPGGARLHRGRSGAPAIAGGPGDAGDGERHAALRRATAGDHR